MAADELLEKSQSFLEEARSLSDRARNAFRLTRKTSADTRNAALLILSDLLVVPEQVSFLKNENAKDVELGRATGLSPSLLDRLKLTDKGIQSMADSLREIAAFPDPVGEVVGGRTLKSGIEMVKKRVPLGTVFTIYESRPNVTVDVGALCVKSGNAALLRGGKEALHSNKALYQLFQQALVKSGMPADAVLLVDNLDRAFMHALLQQEERIDLVVPRGGEGLIKFIVQHSRIPIVKHDKGVCTLFVDASANLENALEIAKNAKLQRPSVCNSIENLLIHERFPSARDLLGGLRSAGATLLGCARTNALDPQIPVIEDPDAEYGQEYLDNRLSVKIVNNVDEAVSFIHRYSSAHSEGIVSEHEPSIQAFVASVDSAAVFVNCSTRFHDGGMMGMGAEVGISTGRLHVRGPMGLADLTTTTYLLRGNGQIRA